MSLLILSYGSGQGNPTLRRSPICYPGTTVYSFTHSMSSTLGTAPWMISCPIKCSGVQETGLVYICYLVDQLYVVVPEQTCKLICDNPVGDWNIKSVPKVVWDEFAFWNHTNTFVGYYNYSSNSSNLFQYYLSKFQFVQLLKPWSLNDV